MARIRKVRKPRRPQALAEMMMSPDDGVDARLREVMFAYSLIGVSPTEMMLARDLFIPVPRIRAALAAMMSAGLAKCDGEPGLRRFTPTLGSPQ